MSTYDDAMARLSDWTKTLEAELSFADYQGFNEQAVYEGIGANPADFTKLMVVCASLRNSSSEKKMKKRAPAVLKLLSRYQVKPRVIDGDTITLTRIAVCFPAQYLMCRAALIAAGKIESYPGMESVKIEMQDFIALNYLRAKGASGLTEIYNQISSVVKLQGGGKFENIPTMKTEFVKEIDKFWKK